MQLSFRLDKRPGESHLALDGKKSGFLREVDTSCWTYIRHTTSQSTSPRVLCFFPPLGSCYSCYSCSHGSSQLVQSCRGSCYSCSHGSSQLGYNLVQIEIQDFEKSSHEYGCSLGRSQSSCTLVASRGHSSVQIQFLERVCPTV